MTTTDEHLTPENVRKALAAARQTRSSTPHTTLSYASVEQALRTGGWRKQEYEWRMVDPAGDDGTPPARINATYKGRIEWWNRGADFVLVHVDEHREGDGAAFILKPLTKQSAASVIARKDRAP